MDVATTASSFLMGTVLFLAVGCGACSPSCLEGYTCVASPTSMVCKADNGPFLTADGMLIGSRPTQGMSAAEVPANAAPAAGDLTPARHPSTNQVRIQRNNRDLREPLPLGPRAIGLGGAKN